jgi:glyoxylase-like metal-dependent hydrolase (beta-lactamase superfamily II)
MTDRSAIAQPSPDQPALLQIDRTLWAARIPIPYPMRFVTVLIDTDAPITLIDTGINTPEARVALQEALQQLGLSIKQVQRVIVTHHHPDHCGLAGWIQAQSGAQILMHELDLGRGAALWDHWDKWIEGYLEHLTKHGMPNEQQGTAKREMQTTRRQILPAASETKLEVGERITLSERSFEVLWLPGHADGHIGLWDSQTKLLIAADAILEGITPNIGLWADSRPDPLGDYLKTLQCIADLEATRAVIGHHGPIMYHVSARAHELQNHHTEVLDVCCNLERPMTAFEVSFIIFPRELPEAMRRFAMVETLAHLEHLRLRGVLEGCLTEGVYLFAVGSQTR